MTSSTDDDGRYVRVYRTVLRDPKFDLVRADRACLGTWLLLLLEADALWPAPASLPRWATDEHIALLAHVELIVLDGERYRIKGLDKERNAQHAKAKAAAEARWGTQLPLPDAPSNAPSIPPSNAQAHAKSMPPNPNPNPNPRERTDSRSPKVAREGTPAPARTKVTGFTAVLE